jgi:DNA-binding IclR family transcriptional regulator
MDIDPAPAPRADASTGHPANRSLTLERGLRVLRVLASHPDGLSVSELAAELDTHRAGIYRLLGTLAGQRLVVRGADGRYALGLGLLELASAVRSRLQEVAVRELRILADELRATTALTIRDGDEAVVAAVVEPSGTAMRIAYRPGLRHPVDRAAPGLAILAGDTAVPGERSEVAAARDRGWAVTTGEILPGATGVAAPISSPGRATEASISAVWVDPRDPGPMGERVMRAARTIADAL